MNLTIDLSDENAATLASQARAAQMPTERYLAYIIECALERQHALVARQLGQHLDAMASKVPPETSMEQMDAALDEALAAVRPGRSWQS